MNARVRFSTADQIFDAFPHAARDISLVPRGETPLDFGRKLLARAHRFDAITYGAYLLPRREAIWWGCQCLKALDAGPDPAREAAEAWVRDPDEATREAALAHWRKGARRRAGTWIAMAAGYSGGNIATPPAPPRQPPPHATAVGVRAAVIQAIAGAPAIDQPRALQACAEAWLRFAEGGDAKVRLTRP